MDVNKSSSKGISPATWLGGSFFLIAGLLSFYFALKYSGAPKEFPLLHKDDLLESPLCDHRGGFYPGSVTVRLSSALPSSTIYYTTDGSEPGLGSEKYEGSISIDENTSGQPRLAYIPTSPRWKPPLGNVLKGTTLRAIAVAGGRKSRELVRTFFNSENALPTGLPVVCLTVNEADLFGYKNGIYVLGKNYEDKSDYIKKNIPLDLPWWSYPSNYMKKGSNAERPVHLEFFEPGGKEGFEADAGVRINGNKTRGFGQKSLRICFDKKYGTEALDYPVFADADYHKFGSLILRNSGNDWDKTMFRDAFMQELMVASDLDIQRNRTSVVFINGEYWGIHNIRERIDEHYFEYKHHLSTDSIVILESGGKLLFGHKKDPEEFQELLAYVRAHDLSDPAAYDYVAKRIDLRNFMDFIIASVYFCNTDWQEKFWKYRTSIPAGDSVYAGDGRWRWVLYDTDYGFGFAGPGAINADLLETARTTGTIGLIFSNLLKNPEFRSGFKKRFEYHLDNTFKPERVVAKINAFHDSFEPEMSRHIDRWRSIGTVDKWELNVEELRTFARNRPAIQEKQLEKFLSRFVNP
ncbi:MAG: CotH kinase family protein [Bacteroidia bacterium]